MFVPRSRRMMSAILLAVIALPVLASAQTSSDLLEKAVYAEETVGNLDQAIDLYGQVIAKAKVASGVAAEAQYRLGLCLDKQGKKKEAQEAFEAVVDDYPKETEFVTLAAKHLPGAIELLPIPWKDGQHMHFTMMMANGMEIGTEICSIHATELHGKPVWRCSNRVFITLNGANSFSEAFCDKETFAPLQSYWIHSMLGSADATYADDKATIDITGRDDPITLDFTVPGYDNEQGIQIFRRLPLEVDLHTTMTIIATLTGVVLPLEIDVTERETITTALGTFDCLRMELNIGQTFWISDDANRYLVRFQAGGVTADLTRVEQRRLDENLELEDDQISLTLPGGWFAHVAGDDEDDDDHDIYLLDRRAISKGKVRVVDKESLDDDQASPKAWAEKSIDKLHSRANSFKFRGEGVSEAIIGGQEAAVVVFDFEEKKKPMTGYAVALFSDNIAASIQFLTPRDQYEAMREELEQVVNSFRVK